MFKSHFWQVCGTTAFVKVANLVLGFAIFGNLVQRFPYRGKVSLKLPKLANLCRRTLIIAIFGNMYLAIFGNLPAITNIAVYGSYRYWQLLMLPHLADCRKWQLRMLPFMEVTIIWQIAVNGNY